MVNNRAHELSTTKITSKDIVRAALPVQKHWLPLSNLDLLLPPLNVHVIFCYKNEENEFLDFKEKVSVLKIGLAKALVSFYTFAGELVNNNANEPEILCNNRGVDFIEAVSEVKLCDLEFYDPVRCFEGKLLPINNDGCNLSVQVTRLQCGAITIGCTFDHRVADAYSANMFWVTWAEMSTFKTVTIHPCFRRSLLNPRHPLVHDITLNDMYVPISAIIDLNEPETEDFDPLVSRIYHVTAEQLCNLQCLASGCSIGCCKETHLRSKLESFSAFLWKLVGYHAYQCQRDLDGSGFCKMGIVVDGRTRLSDDKDKEKSTSLFSYFGNVLSIPFGEEQCENLKNMSLYNVSNKVHNFLKPATSKGHFMGLIDWVEAHKPEPLVAKVYTNKREDGPAVVISSGQRFPISKVDFGWGKPAFGSYHFPWGGNCGYVMPMPSPLGNGDWVVYMHLYESQLNFIEKEGSNVFKPISLGLIGPFM